MKLSTRARYGTRILVDLARNGSRLSLGEIARSEQVSRSYLQHLITPLVGAGIIGSSRGSGGGICLKQPADRIRLSTVIRLLEGNRLLVECISNPVVCSRSEKCTTRKIWEQVEMAIFNTLDGITLQNLADQKDHALTNGTYSTNILTCQAGE